MTKVLLVLVVAAFSVGLVSCETNPVDPRWYFKYQEYLTKPHFRALAVTSGTSGTFASAFAWSSRHRSVEAAIERALEGCKKGEKKYVRIGECRLHAVGDINVAGMSEEQLDKTVEFYKNNRSATNEDFEKWVASQKALLALALAGSNQFDGAWQGSLSCGSCENCPGPFKKNVNMKIKGGKFDLVPDLSYMGKGAIDDQGNVRIRSTHSRKNFSFDGKYDGESFNLKGQRGLRTCTIELSRATSPVEVETSN